MTEPAENLVDFAITTFFVILSFAVIPGILVVISGFLIGIIASLPILAVASLTRLVSTHSPKDEVE